MTVEEVIKKTQVELSTDSGNSSGSGVTYCDSGSTSFDSNEVRNLIINYLPQHMNETEVFSLFSTIGEVESCKLVRSKETKQNLGYAFVKYKSHESAVEAVKKLNKISLGNKVIKVSYARPSKPEIKDANLYVGGLPSGCTADHLKKLFQKFGDIITCRVVQAETSNDYYFGFVRFDTKKEATEAMEALHGKIPCKEILPNAISPLTVKFAKTPQPETNGFNLNQFLYDTASIWRTPPKSASDDLAKVYGRAHAQYITSMANVKGGDEREFHPTMTKSNSDTNVQYYSKSTSGCSCCPNSGSSSATSSQNINVVLTNLPADASELMLYRLCSKFGAINSVQVFFEENNWFAIVSMLSAEEATQAVDSLNGLLLQPYTPIKAEIY